MSNYDFIKKVEQLIKPKDIATLQSLAPFTKFIPRKIQNKIMAESGKKNPYMGFVVEPYSVFVCYELKDLDWAKQLIPDNFELMETAVFSDGEPKHYIIFSCFNVHTSAFWGTRLEVNLIARNKSNNLLSWVIIDYDTNTLSHDLAKGLIESTTEKALLTTDFDGNIIVDIENMEKNRALVFDCSTAPSESKTLHPQLWLEGNLSVGYGKDISQNSGEVFSLKFDPKEVEKGCSLPPEQVRISQNTWYHGLFHSTPDEVVYFPYAQHYLSDSPGHSSEPKSEADMVEQVRQLDLENMPDYSAAPLRKMIKIGMLFNSLLILVLSLLSLFAKRKKPKN
jgi:hypothetical protein